MGAPGGRSYQHLYNSLPFPQAGLSRLNPGYWFLPSTALTITSITAGALTFTALMLWPESRALFVLPFNPAVLCALSAAIGALLAVRGRHRPTPLLARLWPLVLVAASLLGGLAGLLGFGHDPLVSIFDVSVLVAALAVLPRLLRWNAHGWLLYRVAPIALLLLLVTVGPALFAGQGALAEHLDDDISRWVVQIHTVTEGLQTAVTPSWSDVQTHPGGGARLRLDSWSSVLSDARTSDLRRSVHTWKQAAALGREREVEEAWEGLVGALEAPFRHESPPRLSELGAPAIQQVDERSAASWARNPNLTAISGLVQRYHGSAWAGTDLLFEPGAEPFGATEAMARTIARSDQARARIQAALGTLATSYADGWVVFTLPDEAWAGTPPPSVGSALTVPLVSGAGLDGPVSYQAANLAALFELDWGQAQALAGSGQGCKAREYPHDALGHVFRLDCTTYLPASDKSFANPHVEIRLVWEEKHRRPEGLYYIVAVPEAFDADQYRDLFMNALAQHAEAVGSGKPQDLGRTVNRANGFELVWASRGVISVKPDDGATHGLLRVTDHGQGSALGGGQAKNQTTFAIWAKSPLR
ncbi:MAG: hypothetical protein ABIO70_28945 [Pseudomonadota bacterium]